MHKKYISHDEVILYSETFGSPTAKTCLLIAGAGASARFWTDTFCERISSHGYFVIRYDHRDSGLSSAIDYEPHPYTVYDLAQDAFIILDTYAIEKAHVIGHSMGGLIAQIMAITLPSRIETFTSISMGATKAAKPSEETMSVLMQNNPQGQFESNLEGFMRLWKVLNGTIDLDEDLAITYTKDLYDRTIHKVGVAWNHIKCQEDLKDLLDKLKQNTIPALFIHGQEDLLIPCEASQKAAELCTHSQFKPVIGMGHMFFNRDLEEKIASLLLEHFKTVSDTTQP